MTTHALRTPCPIETVLTWCGRPIDQIVGGEHYVVGLQEHDRVTCGRCREVIADTLEQLEGFPLENRKGEP